MAKTLSRLRFLLQEDGAFLLTYRLSGACLRRCRDFFLTRRLAAPGLHIGRSPRIHGLRRIQLGCGITAGDAFWMEAITRAGTSSYSPELSVGDRCSFSDRVHIAAVNYVKLGDDVLCGSNVLITDHAHGTYFGAGPHSSPEVSPNLRPLTEGRCVVIGSRVWIGDNVAILPGAHIGEGTIIGANSVVTGELAPGVIAYGTPARAVRRWDPLSKSWLPL